MPDKVPAICESCQVNLVEILEPMGDNAPTYCLCKACHHRLINYSLRPSEVFNLVAIHGHDFYLNDDIYDHDTGEATDAREKVHDKKKHPFPKLQAVKDDPAKLLDYACVHYAKDEVIEPLKQLDNALLLQLIDKKIKRSRSIKDVLYEITAKTLGAYAAEWAREQWGLRKKDDLFIYAEMLACCLPFEEAYTLMTNELNKATTNELYENYYCLGYLHNSKVLGWIEQTKARIINVNEGWGRLAAHSMFDWDTAQRWLTAGRPLSLIALDAIYNCTLPTDHPHYEKENAPTLLNAPDDETLEETLKKYLENDNVHRTRTTINAILHHIQKRKT